MWTKGEHLQKQKYYDCILNTLPIAVSKDNLHELLGCVKPYGKWMQVGLPDIEQEEMRIQYFDLVLDSITVVGSLVGGLTHYEEMLKFIAEHGIESMVEHYDFEDFPKALHQLEHGKPHFRCVVDTEKFHLKK